MDQEQRNHIIAETIKKITGFMRLDCQVEIKEEVNQAKETVTVSVYTPENARFLIGKNGQNLRAFEYIIRAIVNNQMPEMQHPIAVDVNDYHKSKALYAIGLAKQIVTKVRSTQRAESLLPMTAYERRMVHMELAAYPDVATESIGEEPHRRIVIKPFP